MNKQTYSRFILSCGVSLPLALIVLLSFLPYAHAQSSYVEATLADVSSQNDMEARQTQELEENALKERATRDRRVRDAEIKINALRLNIEKLKQRQEQAKSEIDSLSTDVDHRDVKLKEISEQSVALEKQTRTTLENLSKLKNDLQSRIETSENQLRAFAKAKSESESKIYANSMDVQRMKKELAELSTRQQVADATRAELETEEMKTRTLWMQAKLDMSEKMRQKDEAVASAQEAKSQYDKSLADLDSERVALAKAERTLSDTEKKTSTDIAKFNADRARAVQARAQTETERLRIESEVGHLQEYALRVKQSRDIASDEEQSAASLTMRARLAQASVKADVIVEKHEDVQNEARKQKRKSEIRGLAAAEEASNLFANAREWEATENCTAFTQPSDRAAAFGKFKIGRKSLARDGAAAGWVEILRGSSAPLYIKNGCGKFSE